MTKEQLKQIPMATKRTDIKKAFEEKYGDVVFETKDIQKIQDEGVRKQLLEAYGCGIEQYSDRIDIFFIEQEDKELGGSIVGFYMMDRKTGKVKRIDNIKPTEEKSVIYKPDGEIDKRGVVQFELSDDSQIVVFREQSGKLSIANQTERGLNFIRSQDMISQEEQR